MDNLMIAVVTLVLGGVAFGRTKLVQYAMEQERKTEATFRQFVESQRWKYTKKNDGRWLITSEEYSPLAWQLFTETSGEDTITVWECTERRTEKASLLITFRQDKNRATVEDRKEAVRKAGQLLSFFGAKHLVEDNLLLTGEEYRPQRTSVQSTFIILTNDPTFAGRVITDAIEALLERWAQLPEKKTNAGFSEAMIRISLSATIGPKGCRLTLNTQVREPELLGPMVALGTELARKL